MDRAGIKDILAGLVFLGLGIAFGYAASGYQLGTALRMGPGYFPLVLASVLAVLGLATIAKGVTAAAAEEPIGPVPWRAAILILGALIFFGATIRGLGLIPTLLVTAFMSGLASRMNTVLSALVLAVGLTLLCVLIFHYGLGVTVPLVGPWLL
jgi:hypothetical protein